MVPLDNSLGSGFAKLYAVKEGPMRICIQCVPHPDEPPMKGTEGISVGAVWNHGGGMIEGAIKPIRPNKRVVFPILEVSERKLRVAFDCMLNHTHETRSFLGIPTSAMRIAVWIDSRIIVSLPFFVVRDIRILRLSLAQLCNSSRNCAPLNLTTTAEPPPAPSETPPAAASTPSSNEEYHQSPPPSVESTQQPEEASTVHDEEAEEEEEESTTSITNSSFIPDSGTKLISEEEEEEWDIHTAQLPQSLEHVPWMLDDRTPIDEC